MRTWELKSKEEKSLALWFLLHERNRHFRDIARADKEIDALLSQGVMPPEGLDIDDYFVVQGVVYPAKEKQ